MAKHAGRMYDPKGIQNTTRGELALSCPACPIPGLNLPLGWENASPDDRYLVMLRLFQLDLTYFTGFFTSFMLRLMPTSS